jgi:hypothetical protein
MAPFDGLKEAPRPGEPESALLPGMAAPKPLASPPGGGQGTPAIALAAMPDTSQPGPVALQEPPSWAYDFDPGTGSARASFTGIVQFTSGGAATAGVTTWNGRTGAVVLNAADITAAGGLANPSPTLAGVPNTPTAAPGTNSTQIASCQFVQAALGNFTAVSTFNGRSGAVTLSLSDITTAGGAPSASPALTGNPLAPTAAPNDASSSIATTQFVANQIAGGAVVSFNGRKGVVALSLSDVLSVGGAPLASPAFTGTPNAPTPTAGDATTKLATTAFVTAAVTAATGGVASFNTRTGAVVLNTADVVAAGGAPILSPAFTGTPTSPTPGGGDSSTKVATTAFVANAIAAGAGVQSFNGRAGVVALQAADVSGVGGALIASPTFTGNPKAPTPAVADNSTSLATTAFVAAGFMTPAQVAASYATVASLAAYAPLASPALTGSPTAPTQAPGDNDTSIATTAFVTSAIAAKAAAPVQTPTLAGNVVVGTTMTAATQNTGAIGAAGQVWELIGRICFCDVGGGGSGYWSHQIWNGAAAVDSVTYFLTASGPGMNCAIVMVAQVTLAGPTTFVLRSQGPSSFSNMLADGTRLTAKRIA